MTGKTVSEIVAQHTPHPTPRQWGVTPWPLAPMGA